MMTDAGSFDPLVRKDRWTGAAALVVSPYVERGFFETLARDLRPRRLHVVIDDGCRRENLKTVRDAIAACGDEQLDRTLKTNLYALFWITQAALPHIPAGASVINTASVVAYHAPQILLDYATTKAGIVAFTKALAKQQIAKGIRVNAVAPGPFWTVLQPSGGQPQEAVEKFGSEVPMGRPGQPVELAPVYVFLASQEASFVTGEVYAATGGNGTA